MFPFQGNFGCHSNTGRSSGAPDHLIDADQKGVCDINAEVMRDVMFIKQRPSSGFTHQLRVLYEESQINPMQSTLTYTCQLAHGSSTVELSNFSSVGELYAQMAYAFGISCDDIIFCTINTYEADMDRLFIGCIEPGDILYAHVRGRPLEVEIIKKEETLGITIADNGMCRAFIKHIKEYSITETAKRLIVAGQQITSIQGQSVLGLRHYEVAKVIHKIPTGQKFSMGLINPLTPGAGFIQTRSMEDGKNVIIQQDGNKQIIGKLNDLFYTYLGVQDDELVETVWGMVKTTETLGEMMHKIRYSELNDFDFPDKLLFDMWRIVSDPARMTK